MRLNLLLGLILVWISACSSTPESPLKKTSNKSSVPPPPPPPDGIWDKVDSVAATEETYVYVESQLVRKVANNNNMPCCYRFRSFFEDIQTIGIRKNHGSSVFFFSRFNNPMHRNEKTGKMEDIWIDDEWQDILFFQILDSCKAFHYVNNELLECKLTSEVSSMGGLVNDSRSNYQIKEGFLHGQRLNDSTWHIKLKASYPVTVDDSTWEVEIKLDNNFRVGKKDTLTWRYSCENTK
ncbi:hypothetical protein [Hymenobacter jejuensis]|uniref:Lipoprotein n=1 Tax=Hymenobacter jejuensis TaxID=2502781 RepID=A0A5B8A1I4_9BACT|nr:hypothetical protein [Hymenobacter jejuensis]QDA60979.1 hypothetical protein FHG12_13075 [Hymenobacter jejuensis]